MHFDQKDDINREIIEIKGMTCEHCVNRVKTALEKSGDLNADVDLSKGTATVSSLSHIDNESLKKAVKEAGYKIKKIHTEEEK